MRGSLFIGPCRFFGFYGPRPFGSLNADSNGITLSALGCGYRFERSAIAALVRIKMCKKNGVRLYHSKDGRARWFVFLTQQIDETEALLRSNGFVVAPDGAEPPDLSSVRYSDTFWSVLMVGTIVGFVAGLVALAIRLI